MIPAGPLGPAGFAFTGREGGASRGPFASLNLSFRQGDDPGAVESNRLRVAGALGISADWATLRQVHSGEVHLTERPGEELAAADALVTAAPGLPLAVFSADCPAIALAGTRTCAAVHAGWRGMAAGVLEAAVECMVGAGEDRGSIVAVQGPSIGPCHYPVGPDLVEVFRDAHPRAPDFTRPAPGGGASFDLRAAASWLLREAGAREAPGPAACTACDPGLFSYRRDAVTGRQALVVWIRG